MNGLGVYDFIIKEQFDPSTGEVYEALTSYNNEEMAERCKVKNAHKVVYCVKANAEFNSNTATSLRAGIKNGNVNFLVNEFDAEETVKKVSGYKSMSPAEQAKLLEPYAQTSMMVNEMINLEHTIVNDKVKLKERSGMRKDRVSSVQYNYAVVQELARNLNNKTAEDDILDKLAIRPAKKVGAF